MESSELRRFLAKRRTGALSGILVPCLLCLSLLVSFLFLSLSPGGEWKTPDVRDGNPYGIWRRVFLENGLTRVVLAQEAKAVPGTEQIESAPFSTRKVLWIGVSTGIGTILIMVFGMFLWNRSLRALVSQRTEELQQELNERIRAEEALHRAREELEARVEERMADLRYANQQLQLEVIEHKVTEAKLSESEERFRLLAEFAPFCIALRNQYGEIEYLNPRFVEVFGYTLSDIPTEERWFEKAFADRQYRESLWKEWQKFLLDHSETGVAEDHTVRVRCRDGRYKMTRVRSVTVEKGRFLFCFEDVTDQLKAEEERARLAIVIEQASELVILTDLEGCIQYVNLAFEKTTGYTRGDVIGTLLPEFGKNDDGVPLEPGLLETLKRGDAWRGHLAGKTKQGGNYEVEATFSPIRGISGEIVGLVSVQRDVTNEILLEKQLRQSQKMEAIGTLAGGIAHDFNNILAAIMGYTEMSLNMIPKGSLAQLNLDQVLKAANRAKDLVRQILLFSRRGEQERQPLIMASSVKEALKLLRASLPATVEIRKTIGIGPDCLIMGDPTQIHQVMLNLCTNAAHAMKDNGGVLEVELAEDVLDVADLPPEPDLKPGPYLRLTVRDTGHGMEKEVLERIFEPFFTTKDPFEGTGMGLAVVHGIVKRHEGFIRVFSEKGEGTVFHVFFPKVASAEAPGDMESRVVTKGHGRILFVDDEEALTRLAQEMLESLGYKVTVVRDGVEALGRFEARPDEFDLVITDYTMPKMTGLEFAGEVLRIRPDIPVILCSGYSQAVSEEKIKEMGVREFVLKPIRVHEIAEIIARLLNST